MDITIRRIRADDGTVLRRVRLAALTDAPGAFGSTLERELAFTAEEWTERAVGASAGPDRVTFLAEASGVVVGLVGAFRTDTRVDLVSMWTAPSHRRLGLGRLLVDAVVEWTTASGVDCVELWVTRGNDAALRMYEAADFHITGDHQPVPSDPCVDEIRMRRTL